MTVIFNIFARQTLTDYFEGLHQNVNCAFHLSDLKLNVYSKTILIKISKDPDHFRTFQKEPQKGFHIYNAFFQKQPPRGVPMKRYSAKVYCKIIREHPCQRVIIVTLLFTENLFK